MQGGGERFGHNSGIGSAHAGKHVMSSRQAEFSSGRGSAAVEALQTSDIELIFRLQDLVDDRQYMSNCVKRSQAFKPGLHA